MLWNIFLNIYSHLTLRDRRLFIEENGLLTKNIVVSSSEIPEDLKKIATIYMIPVATKDDLELYFKQWLLPSARDQAKINVLLSRKGLYFLILSTQLQHECQIFQTICCSIKHAFQKVQTSLVLVQQVLR